MLFTHRCQNAPLLICSPDITSARGRCRASRFWSQRPSPRISTEWCNDACRKLLHHCWTCTRWVMACETIVQSMYLYNFRSFHCLIEIFKTFWVSGFHWCQDMLRLLAHGMFYPSCENIWLGWHLQSRQTTSVPCAHDWCVQKLNKQRIYTVRFGHDLKKVHNYLLCFLNQILC